MEMPDETELNENGISKLHLLLLNMTSGLPARRLTMMKNTDPKALKERKGKEEEGEGGFTIYTISGPKNPGNSAREDSVYDEIGEIYKHESGNQYLKVKQGTAWVYVENKPPLYPIIEKSAMKGGRRRRRRGTRRTKRRSHKNRK